MKLGKRIASVNGFKLADNWFVSLEMCDEEEARQELLDSWGASDRVRGDTCPACQGRGLVRRESVGCGTCLGLGVV